MANLNIIEYITVSTEGNSTDFGDLSTTVYNFPYGCGNGTRAIFAGGTGFGVTIEFVVVATTGNSSDFGDLVQTRRNGRSLSNTTLDRGVCGGGSDA